MYQCCKKGQRYNKLLNEQHKSEDNSQVEGHRPQMPCATDVEVFVTSVRVTSCFFFISDLWSQTDGPPYHRAPRGGLKHTG